MKEEWEKKQVVHFFFISLCKEIFYKFGFVKLNLWKFR